MESSFRQIVSDTPLLSPVHGQHMLCGYTSGVRDAREITTKFLTWLWQCAHGLGAVLNEGNLYSWLLNGDVCPGRQELVGMPASQDVP